MLENLSEANPVKSIAEEYLHIRQERCEKCGGALTPRKQMLVHDKDRRYDILVTTCSVCGAKRTFLFDITSFFGKTPPMPRKCCDDSA